jgi:antitoxin YefM
MPRETTYTHARQNLARLCDEVAERHEPIVIRRRAAEPVALIAAAELEALEETAHLLRSPRNARRLLDALERAKAGKGERLTLLELRERLDPRRRR